MESPIIANGATDVFREVMVKFMFVAWVNMLQNNILLQKCDF